MSEHTMSVEVLDDGVELTLVEFCRASRTAVEQVQVAVAAQAASPAINAVMVEGGGYGGSTAAPIARKIFDAHLLGKIPEGMEVEGDDAVSAPVMVGREIQVGVPAAVPASGTAASTQAAPASSTPPPAVSVPEPRR